MDTWDLAELEELADRAAAVARSFDGRALAPTDAARVVELTTRVERSVNGVRLQAAALASQAGVWKRAGHRSDADWYAQATGKPVGEAIADVRAGLALRDLPKVADAVSEGRLSPAEAREITGAAAEAPDEQDQLLATAGRGLAGVRDACRDARARADRDLEARRARINAARTATRHDESDGTSVLTLKGTPDRIGRMWARAEHLAKAKFDQARIEGRREPWAAYLFDAIEEQLHSDGTGNPMPVGAGAKIIFRVDWEACTRGHAEPGELCEQIGAGPVPVSVVREAMEDAFIAAVVTEGTDIRLVTHLGRRPSVLQSTALQFRSPTCVVAGCNRSVRLETDHAVDWTYTKVTTLDWLERHCHEHHSLKTREGWAVEPREGAADPEQRQLLPPDPAGPPPAARRGKTDLDPQLREALQAALARIEQDREQRRERSRQPA
jgi:hypothetical protein